MKNKILFSILLFMAIFTSCEKEPQIVKRALELHELETFGDSVKLSWDINNKNIKYVEIHRIAYNSKEDGGGYPQYATFEIDTITTNTFTDTNLPTKKYVCYKVVGKKIVNEYEHENIGSNEREHIQPNLNIVTFNMGDAIICQELNTVFFINDDKIKSYNYNTQEEKEIEISYPIGNCSINKDGNNFELITTRSYGDISFYNAKTLTYIKSSLIDNDSETLISAIVKDDLIFCSLGYNEILSVFRKSTREKLSVTSDFYGGSYYSNLQLIPNSEYELINNNGDEIYYYQIDKNGNKVKSYEYDLPYGCNKKFSIFPNSNKIIVAPNGLILSKEFQTITSLSSGNYNFSNFVINDSETKIYAASSNKSEIKVYDANNFKLLETIKTKGVPTHISYKNGELISISKIEDYSFNYNDYVVEKIKHQ